MNNSYFLRYLLKIITALKTYYRNSLFNKVYTVVDGFFANAAVNSEMVKLFSKKNSADILYDSLTYRLIKKIIIVYNKLADVMKAWILNSLAYKYIKYSISQMQNSLFRLIGILGSTFIFANIVYSLISDSFSVKSLIIKMILLFILLALSTVRFSIREAYFRSKCFRFVKWLETYEN